MRRFLTLFLALSTLASGTDHAETTDTKARLSGVSFIVSAQVPVNFLSMDDLRALFLGSSITIQNTRLRPILDSSSAAHKGFLRTVVGKTDSGLTAYYRSLVFTGKGEIPKELTSESKAAAYVRETPGAIAYVTPVFAASLNDSHVKTIQIR